MNWFKDKKTFLIISPESWGKNMLSKHHYALELANKGHEVYFLNPPGSKLYEQRTFDSAGITIMNHFAFRGSSRLFDFSYRFIQRLEIRLILLKMSKKPDVVWSFDPFRLQWLKYFDSQITIYHSIDNHFTKKEAIIESEADFVFSNMYSTLQKFTNPRKFFVGHGLAEHFVKSSFCKLVLPGRNRTSVGYVGNLGNQLIDFAEIEKIISKNPQVDFYFIGPTGESNLGGKDGSVEFNTILEAYKNVYYLGQKNSAELPDYLYSFNILLLIYKQDRSGHIVNPHKLLEYLSSGNIVIATLMKEVLPETTGLIEKISNSSQLSHVFEKVLSKPLPLMAKDKIERRKRIAADHTYDKKLRAIFDIIEGNYETKSPVHINSVTS